MRFYNVFCLIFLLVTFVEAQTPAPEQVTPVLGSPTVEVPSPTPTRPSDLSSLRVDLALSNMDLFPSTDNRMELISALEEDIGRKCFGAIFHTFYYDPQASSSACLTVTELALSKDPSNPTALCARYGFEAPSCREASLSQELVDDTSVVSSTKLELDIKLAMGRVDRDAANSEGELMGMSSAFGTQEEKERRRAPLRKLVRLRCQFSRSFPKTIESTPTPTPVPGLVIPDVPFERTEKVPQKDSLKNPLEDLMGTFAKTPKPSAPDIQAKRYRIVSKQCMKAIKDLAADFSGDSFISCYRDGVYSPRCIESLKVEREKAMVSASGTPLPLKSSESGLEPF